MVLCVWLRPCLIDPLGLPSLERLSGKAPLYDRLWTAGARSGKELPYILLDQRSKRTLDVTSLEHGLVVDGSKRLVDSDSLIDEVCREPMLIVLRNWPRRCAPTLREFILVRQEDPKAIAPTVPTSIGVPDEVVRR